MRRSSEAPKRILSGWLILMGAGVIALLAGCGGSNQPPKPVPGQSTNVVVLLTSTANDKLTQFDMAITSVSLSDSAGNTVSLFNKPFIQNGATGLTEFMRLNGASQPLAAGSVPQGTYTSASIKVASCQFAVADVVSGGLVTSLDAQGLCGQGTGNTTVNLPAPITVSGQAMALSFNLQVPQSYTLSPANAYTISPVFTLTPVAISPNPSNDSNGKITGLAAQITSVNAAGNSFVAQTADGTSLTMSSNSSTQFQGATGLAALAAGTLVNLDSVIQPNGTLLATRLELESPAAVTSDLFLPLSPASPLGSTISQPLECFPAPGTAPVCNSAYFFNNSTVSHISGQMSNLPTLPFTPVFNSSSFVLGQSVSVASNTTQLGSGGMLATDVTLEPQTLNGTVSAVSNISGFAVYTVTIAPYHAIPVTQHLAALGPFSTIPNPTTVTIYADANTQQLQAGPIGPGSLLRFRGLLFNDNGTLRMDCGLILDGVPE